MPWSWHGVRWWGEKITFTLKGRHFCCPLASARVQLRRPGMEERQRNLRCQNETADDNILQTCSLKSPVPGNGQGLSVPFEASLKAVSLEFGFSFSIYFDDQKNNAFGTAGGWQETLIRRLQGFQSFHERSIVEQSVVEPMVDGQSHVVGAGKREIVVRILLAGITHELAIPVKKHIGQREEPALSLLEGCLLCRTCSSVWGRRTGSRTNCVVSTSEGEAPAQARAWNRRVWFVVATVQAVVSVVLECCSGRRPMFEMDDVERGRVCGIWPDLE
ncbi:hypothetical protein QBC37DRAFT_478667 [Rhypophila decipiens]|uniref:Uncharacterized protein n=1 Tax=Rhypophila decipiens TaxID=261697 RepID=A0AAN6YH30_9PEZI|nr:hypothetical protein QBC37DRAFT_478667 [Rhypophila decipiens]